MGYSIDSINTLAGGTYAYDILGLNAICIAQGGTGGHTYSIDALNEICTLLGATAGHTYIIDALNAISVAIGGSGGYTYEDSAWSAIAASGLGLSSMQSKMAIWLGNLDFANNKWIDKSGNGNDAILKNASARTGNGSNLDYTITGLLTTDTIEVVTGSDTPTIPSNGTLRIGAAQVVFGVTIRRSGAVWALIPFCEPIITPETSMLPNISYDVSGNSHHATAAALVSGNVTTQSNYFYLAEHGYSLGKDILNWNMLSWSGTFPNRIFSGITNIVASTNAYIEEGTANGGNSCKYHSTATESCRLRTSGTTIGKKYRLLLKIESVETQSNYGIYVGNSATGVLYAGQYGKTGLYSKDYVANGGNFQIERGGIAGTTLEFSSGECHEFRIVPALLTKDYAADGGRVMYPAVNGKWLRWTCDLQFPANSNLLLADQKGSFGDKIISGKCITGKTYIIEKTEPNHFGSGKVVFDQFVSDGTEICNSNNAVRERALNNSNVGLLFSDSGVPNTITFDTLKLKYHHFLYNSKPYTSDPDWTVFDNNYMSDLFVLKSNVFVDKQMNDRIVSLLAIQEEIDIVPIVFSFDHVNSSKYAYMHNLFNSRNAKACFCWNYAGHADKATMLQAMSDGHEVLIHTAWDWDTDTFIPSYKGFHENSENYTAETLAAYYNDAIEFYRNELGVTIKNHSYPGGAYDPFTLVVAKQYFRASRMASGGGYYGGKTYIPIKDYAQIGAYSLDTLGTTELNTMKSYVDAAISGKYLLNFYGHPEAEMTDTELENLGLLIDYINTKSATAKVRIMTLDQALDLIENEL